MAHTRSCYQNVSTQSADPSELKGKGSAAPNKIRSGKGRELSHSRRCVSFQDTAGEPLYKLFKALKHQVEKGPVDAKVKKAKYTLNDTGLLGDDVEYSMLVGPDTHTHTHTRSESVAELGVCL